MGLSLGGVFGGALGFLVGGPAGAAIGYGMGSSADSQKRTNELNIDQANRQMEFQNEMSSTAYQRATADMQQAGLNPMLAYSHGGASTPSGAKAEGLEDPTGSGVKSAISMAQSVAQVKQQVTQADLNKATTLRQMADARQANSSASMTDLQLAYARDRLGGEAKSAKFRGELDAIDARERSERYSTNFIGRDDGGRTLPEHERWMRDQEEKRSPGLFRRGQAEARRSEAEALLREYQEPGARNERDYQRSGWGGKYEKYLPTDIFSSAGSIGLKFRD